MVPSASRSPFDISRLDVMVVDDEAAVNVTVRDMLRHMGVRQVCTARDGYAAYDILDQERHPVSAVIADWNMPRMDGIELFKAVRGRWPEIGFVLLTGRCDAQSVLDARAHGVENYLRKPFSLEQLRTRLMSVSARMQQRAA